MRRRALMSGSLILLLWMTIPAQAFTDLGHICFQATPFADVIDFHVKQADPADVLDRHVKQADPSEPFFALSALWQGADVYALPGGGIAYGSSHLGLKLSLSHDTPFFQGNRICPFSATLDATLSGPWVLTCYGAEVAIDLTGVLVLVPCGGQCRADDRVPAARWPAGG